MAESHIYQAGYQHAIEDVCAIYDEVHRKYQQLWKDGRIESEEGQRYELTLLTLNTVICDLETRRERLGALQ